MQRFSARLKPVTIVALLLTLLLIFTVQGQVILHAPLNILLIAIPVLLQNYCMFGVAFALAYACSIPFDVAAPAVTNFLACYLGKV